MTIHQRFMAFAMISLAFASCTVSKVAAQDNPKISGYVKAAFSHTETMSETDVTNARIKISGDIENATDYVVFIDAVRDDILMDAYINRELVDGFSLKIGQYKTPFSTDNLVSGSKVTFINRPYMKNDVSPTFRDKGVQLTYSNHLIDAVAAVMNGSGQNKDDFNNNKSMAYRVVAKVLPQMNLSGNFYTGKNTAGSDTAEDFINVGANGTIGALEYSGEFAQMKYGALTGNAYFAWVAYDIDVDNKFMTLLTPAVRIERSDPDTDRDNDAKSRYTLGLSASFTQKYANRIMVNYEVCDVETGNTENRAGIEYQITF